MHGRKAPDSSPHDSLRPLAAQALHLFGRHLPASREHEHRNSLRYPAMLQSDTVAAPCIDQHHLHAWPLGFCGGVHDMLLSQDILPTRQLHVPFEDMQ